MSVDTGYATLRSVIEEFDPQGWAAEFGVYSGYSLGIIAEHMPVVGFDSFEGLPEDWREGFPKGTFSMEDEPHLGWNLLPAANAMVVPGWFSDTAPEFPFPPLGLVHIDCDLYSSTVTALESVYSAMSVGTLVVFDEYHGYPGANEHESKAWKEFCERYRIVSTPIALGDEEAAFRIEQIGTRR